MPTRKERQALRVRNAIIAFVALVAILVIGFGTWYSTGISDGEYREGTHYELVDEPQRRRAGAPMRVREFFSYGCIHCRNFDPLIEDWKSTLPEDVVFERTPVAFSPTWTLLARAYYTLEAVGALDENHDRLFRAIHDNRRQFLSAEMLADFVDGYGTTRAAFLRAFESAPVQRQVREAEEAQRAMGITSVPTLVIDGAYRVGMNVGRKTALDVASHLIARSRNGADDAATLSERGSAAGGR
ncbi:MAG: thiol:disulfide interchange protein DsbA/DsbL [Pseudomonadota bacterium]